MLVCLFPHDEIGIVLGRRPPETKFHFHHVVPNNMYYVPLVDELVTLLHIGLGHLVEIVFARLLHYKHAQFPP